VRSIPLAGVCLVAALLVPSGHAADTIAVLPLFNQNESSAPNLDWIGEGVAETIHESLSSAGLLVLAREDREEVYRRLSVRTGVVLTKASVIKIGETLDAEHVIYGEFKVDPVPLPAAPATSLQSQISISLHVVDLRKFHEAPPLSQTGPLMNLSQMETELAWTLMKQLDPSTPPEADFLRDRPAVPIDAMESYVRGLMAANADQKIKLFSQAARIDEHFSQPAFQLGRLMFQKKDYKTAGQWLAKVTRSDSHYMEGSFLLGICYYYQGDFDGAIRQFRMVTNEIPLNEVYNNLGAALSRRNDTSSLYNFNKALEGDQADPDYWFNAGYALWKQGQFAQAADKFRGVLDRSAGDQEATSMLGRCLRSDGPRPGDPRTEGRERIKTTFEDSAFRQLQAELKSKPAQ
jgi:tetratricopeptide (TPR) repeat protein